MESDGFQLVCKRKAARRRKLLKTVNDGDDGLNLSQENVNKCVGKIFEAKLVLQSSEGFIDFKNNLKNITTLSQTQGKKCNISSVVCYGLGLPSSSRIAKYQTALLLLLRDHFCVEAEIYDPLLTKVDTRVLQELKLHVLTKNEEGKRYVKRATVFFMPHCGKELYNNLLWANWNPVSLPLCIIIGNSFSSIVQNVPSQMLKEHYKFIYLAEGLCKEYPLKTLVEYDDIFNETSIHVISEDIVSKKEDKFWCEKCEPQYDECNVAIIRVKVDEPAAKLC